MKAENAHIGTIGAREQLSVDVRSQGSIANPPEHASVGGSDTVRVANPPGHASVGGSDAV